MPMRVQSQHHLTGVDDMPYPPMMMESLRKLEASRQRRLEQEIPLLTLDEKMKLLESCHPDYRPGIKTEIPVGANQGQPASKELVELLASESMLSPETIDLGDVHHDVDVLVIGGGGGGATAALFAKSAGAKVMITTKLRFGDSNTIMAEGGINACTSKGDSPVRYFIDTMGGGGFTNTPAMVRSLVEDSPLIIQWLEKLGVPFYKNKDGNFINRHIAGGHTRPRGHAVGDYTGMSIMQILRDEVLNQEIDVIEHNPAIELVMDEGGRCAGAICMNVETRQMILVKAKVVILATGGLGRIHVQGFPTTNHYGATADGIVMAYRAGVGLLYIDSIQFHPTGTCFPAQVVGLLVSETSRGKGAQLVNVNGERFINELETRDAVASAIIREVSGRGNGIETPIGNHGIWLDTPVIDIRNGKGFIKNYFKHLHHRFAQYDIDFSKEPILVYPSQHYQNGGVVTDEFGRTTIPGLYVVGEAGGGVHGKNRLGGNSLTDIFVFGRRAGIDAGKIFSEVEVGKLTLTHVAEYNAKVRSNGLNTGKTSPVLFPDYRFEQALPTYNQ